MAHQGTHQPPPPPPPAGGGLMWGRVRVCHSTLSTLEWLEIVPLEWLEIVPLEWLEIKSNQNQIKNQITLYYLKLRNYRHGKTWR
jgi:hypothetical protein